MDAEQQRYLRKAVRTNASQRCNVRTCMLWASMYGVLAYTDQRAHRY